MTVLRKPMAPKFCLLLHVIAHHPAFVMVALALSGNRTPVQPRPGQASKLPFQALQAHVNAVLQYASLTPAQWTQKTTEHASA